MPVRHVLLGRAVCKSKSDFFFYLHELLRNIHYSFLIMCRNMTGEIHFGCHESLAFISLPQTTTTSKCLNFFSTGHQYLSLRRLFHMATQLECILIFHLCYIFPLFPLPFEKTTGTWRFQLRSAECSECDIRMYAPLFCSQTSTPSP